MSFESIGNFRDVSCNTEVFVSHSTGRIREEKQFDDGSTTFTYEAGIWTYPKHIMKKIHEIFNDEDWPNVPAECENRECADCVFPEDVRKDLDCPWL